MTTYLTQPLTDEVRSRIVSNRDRVLLLSEERKAICDFCGNHDPLLMYEASQSTTGAKVPNWLWRSCERCSSLVKAQDWKGLSERMYTCYEEPLKKMFSTADSELVRRAIDCSLFDFLLYATKVEAEG